MLRALHHVRHVDSDPCKVGIPVRLASLFGKCIATVQCAMWTSAQNPRYDDPRYDDPRYDDPRYDDPRYDELPTVMRW